VDIESGEALDQVLADDALRRYRARLRAHQAQIEGEARRVGARWTTVGTMSSLEAAVKALVAARVLEPRGRA
jgi:hypothetical protein